MKLRTYWKVWYLGTDGIWQSVTNELGNITSCFFDDLESAEKGAQRLAEGKDVVTVEVREERSVLSLRGAAHESVER